ncbi:hypothetical protein MKY85_17435 [Paenibacillus sp. FSL R5-0749]|uniref:hypothetical protein n=1 Tax=Paenibacillus sp. FSL R5-0749 TaxID=2921657 RepID=UPI00315A8CFD
MSTTSGYEWYLKTNYETDLSQGDILLDLPVPMMQYSEEDPFYKIARGKISKSIVVTQACDLENSKVSNLAICPIEPLSVTLKKLMEKEIPGVDLAKLTSKQKEKKQKLINEIRQGTYLDYYLLNSFQDSNVGLEYSVVLLRETFYIPVQVASTLEKKKKEERLRLLPPYREHLAQAYARNFNRIGLPIDVLIDEKEIIL